ncbi:MAG: hypothetical protein JKY62_16315 [Desulfocapsa sp.]|nr:hypothetical protein [Desulfocapsa sp.]
MDVELIIAPEAQQDVEQACNWYENHKVGLGEEFVALQNCILKSLKNTEEH